VGGDYICRNMSEVKKFYNAILEDYIVFLSNNSSQLGRVVLTTQYRLASRAVNKGKVKIYFKHTQPKK
jgi:hypothetical protein